LTETCSQPTTADDRGDKPTPRAVTERLQKIKVIAASKGVTGLEGALVNTGRCGPSSASSTPRKPKTPSSSKKTAVTPASKKRKIKHESEVDDDDDGDGIDEKELKELMDETPSKKRGLDSGTTPTGTGYRLDSLYTSSSD